MKTKIFLTVIAVFVAVLANGQTRQQKKVIEQIDSKIERLIELQSIFGEIESLESRLRPSHGWSPTGAEKAALESRLSLLQKRLSGQQRAFATNYSSGEDVSSDLALYLRQKNQLEHKLIVQALQETVPKEISPREARRRYRSLGVREGESSFEHRDAIRDMSIQKLESASVEADPVQGYKGLLFNDTKYTKVTFVVKSPTDIDEISQPLYAGEKREIFLLPGEYEVYTYVDGYHVSTKKLRVRPKANLIIIDGKSYNFAVIKDNDGRY